MGQARIARGAGRTTKLRATDWERHVASALRKAGWHVIRTSGSPGGFDIIALRGDVYMCVDCATDHVRARRKLARMRGLAESGQLSGVNIGHLWVATPTVPRTRRTVCLVNAGDQHPRFFIPCDWEG